MATLNGDDAIVYMKAKVTNVAGSCLNTVWMSYGSHSSIGPYAGRYPNAIDGWNHATKKHPGDWNPPAGYPVYFDKLSRPRYAGDTTYPCGDVVLSLGGGLCIATDGAGPRRIAIMTLAKRAAQIGRAYLGWTEDFLGYDVVTHAGSTAASSGSTTITPKEELMTYSLVKDAQSATIWLVSLITGGKAGIGSIYHVQVLQRAKKSNADDPMLAGEMDTILAPYLATANAGLKMTMPTLDTAKLASAVADALAARKIAATVDPGDFVKPLDEAFTRSINAIARASADATKTAIGFDPTKLTMSIADALKASGIVAAVDQATVESAVSEAVNRATVAIARAVNDEAAARMVG